jgi:hypothetical protein
MTDELKNAAIAFSEILNKNYNVILGYKGKSVNLTISFDAVHFKHLAGLHKLIDKEISTDDARVVFRKILDNEIKLIDISDSNYFNSIKDRFLDLKNIEKYFDDFTEIFGWNKKMAALNKIPTKIEADYLVKDKSLLITNSNAYIFLGITKIDKPNRTLHISPVDIVDTVPISFFNDKKDYSGMQKRYTLLLKEKNDKVLRKSTLLYQNPHYIPNITELNKSDNLPVPKIVNLDGAEILDLTKFSQGEQAKEKNTSDNNKLEERTQRTQNETNEISFIPNLPKAQTKNNSSNKGISSSEKRSLNDFKFPKKQQSESTVQNRENQPQNRNNYNDFSR